MSESSVQLEKEGREKLVKPAVGSQIVAHTQMETGDGPNKPDTINL